MKIAGLIVLMLTGWLLSKPVKRLQDQYKPLITYQGDTSAYVLDNFVAHQQNYDHKALSVLLTRLEIPVKSYLPISGGNAEGELPQKYIGIYLKFFSYEAINQKKKANRNPATLVIYFKTPPSIEKSDESIRPHHTFNVDSMRQYFGRQIVDSIDYVHYRLHQ